MIFLEPKITSIRLAATLCTLLAASTASCTTNSSVLYQGAKRAGYNSVERPPRPTVTRLESNVTEIKTNGYDITLEDYLRDDRRTLVNLGPFWCTPCTWLNYKIKFKKAYQ